MPNWLTTSLTCARPTVRERSFKTPAGTLLYQGPEPRAERVLRDMVNDETHSVRIDSKMQFELLRRSSASSSRRPGEKLECYAGERPIFDLHKIDEEIAAARWRRRVELESGGTSSSTRPRR